MNNDTTMDTEQSIYAVLHARFPHGREDCGGILMMADTGVAFQGLQKAARECFPGLEVILSNQIPDEGMPGSAPQLVLIHAGAFRNLSAVVARLRDKAPNTPIGLMVESGWSDDPVARALVAEKLVQGVLPFQMQIQVWLATVWLLLNGGEYFTPVNGPRSLIGGMPRRSGSTGDAGSNTLNAAPSRVLSSRETEVFELMSEGLQNKLIAARMDLSEHTVKVHVHNIIRKLKVHNRTQAAAVYRSYERRHGFEPSLMPSVAQFPAGGGTVRLGGDAG